MHYLSELGRSSRHRRSLGEKSSCQNHRLLVLTTMPPKKKITVPKAAVPVAVTNGSKKPNSSPNVTIGKAPLAGLGATPSPTPSPMESPVTGTSQQNSTTKRKREAMQKFYAVRFGKAPGVYLTWAECKSQVSGFTGALCKKPPKLTRSFLDANRGPSQILLY